jgi:hypothetical protein
MVKLFDTDIQDQGRQSSKGNQLKFERDGIWYKADYLGYEGLAEYVISALLHFSDLDPSEYVDYEPEQIEYNGNVYPGCRSRDFTGGWCKCQYKNVGKVEYKNVGFSPYSSVT